MAMSAVYTNFGGMLVHEDRAGTERQYVRDPLGSLIGEIDADQELIYSAEYWPYGEEHSTDGLRQSGWGFVGLLGYLKDLASLLYVRARHYMPQRGRWLTVDPLWPRERAYNYALAIPNVFVDPSGRNLACIGCGVCLGATALALLLSCLRAKDIIECMKCKLLTNPAVAAALVICGAVCIACVGVAVINWLKGLGTGGLVGAGALASASGPGTSPCGEGNPCEAHYVICKTKWKPRCLAWWEPHCDNCYAQCKGMGKWPNYPPCDYWNWDKPDYSL